MTKQQFFERLVRMEAEQTALRQQLRPHLQDGNQSIAQRYDESTGYLAAIAEIRALVMEMIGGTGG